MHCFEGHHVTTLGEITSNSGTHHVQVRKLWCTVLHIVLNCTLNIPPPFPPIKYTCLRAIFICSRAILSGFNFYSFNWGKWTILKRMKKVYIWYSIFQFFPYHQKSFWKLYTLGKSSFFLFWGVFKWNNVETTGCPKKHGNSVTNLISSWLWISIVIPNFKSHNVIMSAMNRVKDCKDVSIMSPQDEQ